MTRRERLERKIEKRNAWADLATTRSNALATESHNMMSVIPMGQPILVGHYSENRDRRYRDRAWNKMGASVAQSKLAEHHESKVKGLEHQLDHSIFSDDDNAVEAIQARIEQRERERQLMKERNAAYRKRDDDKLVHLTGMTAEQWDAKLKDAYSWCKQPHPAYELQNLGARITTDKKRLEQIKRQQAEQKAAEETPNGVKIDKHDNGYCTVRFAEKPDYSIIRSLKDAGFRWGAGSWFGQTDKLPSSVAELAQSEKEEAKENTTVYRNKAFTTRNYECTNIVACQPVDASAVIPEQYEPADDSLLHGLTPLWIENGIRYFGYL